MCTSGRHRFRRSVVTVQISTMGTTKAGQDPLAVLRIANDRSCGRQALGERSEVGGHQQQIGKSAALRWLRTGARRFGTLPFPSFFGMRTHHFVIALVAILIAVALVSNYYLW